MANQMISLHLTEATLPGNDANNSEFLQKPDGFIHVKQNLMGYFEDAFELSALPSASGVKAGKGWAPYTAVVKLQNADIIAHVTCEQLVAKELPVIATVRVWEKGDDLKWENVLAQTIWGFVEFSELCSAGSGVISFRVRALKVSAQSKEASPAYVIDGVTGASNAFTASTAAIAHLIPPGTGDSTEWDNPIR